MSSKPDQQRDLQLILLGACLASKTIRSKVDAARTCDASIGAAIADMQAVDAAEKGKEPDTPRLDALMGELGVLANGHPLTVQIQDRVVYDWRMWRTRQLAERTRVAPPRTPEELDELKNRWAEI